jgi:WD40 repeat protein
MIKFWQFDGTLLKTLTGHGVGVWDISASPDGRLFASASDDKTVKLWKPDGTLLRTFRGHRARVYRKTGSKAPSFDRLRNTF